MLTNYIVMYASISFNNIFSGVFVAINLVVKLLNVFLFGDLAHVLSVMEPQ